MSDFRVILVEGLFYEQDGHPCVEEDGGRHVRLAEILQPVVGQRVQFALHHLPPHGVDESQPGAGSCRYPAGRGCPAGHDQHPLRLLTFHMEGVLQENPWRIEHFSGTTTPIPFRGMPGHYGRLATSTIADVEAMRERLASLGLGAVQGMSVEDLEKVLERLRKSVGS